MSHDIVSQRALHQSWKWASNCEWQQSHRPVKTYKRSTVFYFPAFVEGRDIYWSSDSFHCSNLPVLHSMIRIVDLSHNTRD